MSHPTDSTLALYAGRDLGLSARLRVGTHLWRCDDCRRRVERYRELRDWLGEQDEQMPAGLDWNGMAAEMRANIRLGLAAGRCVGVEVETPVRTHWLTPATVLPVLVVVVAGWILQSLHPPLRPFQGLTATAGNGVVLEASSYGIGMEKDGRGLTLLHPRAGTVFSSVRGETLRARYVDSDTGQVTISNVYAQ